MIESETIRKIIDLKIGLDKIGEYLGITRQTVAKIRDNYYVCLSEEIKSKIKALSNLNSEEIKKVFEIYSVLNKINKLVLESDSSFIGDAYEAIKYMGYWLTNSDVNKYSEKYLGYMVNFYPRYNQQAFFMRDGLCKEKYPLVTLQVDYKEKKVTNMCIMSFTKSASKKEYDLSDIDFPITFTDFFNVLEDRIKPSPTFLYYYDQVDDELNYIYSNVKNSNIPEKLSDISKIYDLSRMFNTFNTTRRGYGPLLENVLDQFEIDYDKKKLLSDCKYRAQSIIKVVNMVSLKRISEKDNPAFSQIFDSKSNKQGISMETKKRREVKSGKD